MTEQLNNNSNLASYSNLRAAKYCIDPQYVSITFISMLQRRPPGGCDMCEVTCIFIKQDVSSPLSKQHFSKVETKNLKTEENFDASPSTPTHFLRTVSVLYPLSVLWQQIQTHHQSDWSSSNLSGSENKVLSVKFGTLYQCRVAQSKVRYR